MPRIGYGLAAIVFVVDQLVKYWIVEIVRLQEQGTVAVWPFLSLTWVENRGVSMGLLTADTEVGRWLLVGMTGLIALVVGVWIRRERALPEALALGLVLGGALGNIVDRVRLGYVVDFVHLHVGDRSFYVFNVADAAITLGVAILIVRALIGRSGGQTEKMTDA